MSAEATTQRLELPIEGMTCASCANRIERQLNKLDGVEATVNYATEKAAVEFDPAHVDTQDLLGAVAATGYNAVLPHASGAAGATSAEVEDDHHLATLRHRLVGAAVLSTPVLLLAMLPALQFDYWQWLSLQLATPVVLWAGWPFHRAAWQNLRHGTATMDTLISVGTLAAWGWSVVALFLLGAGTPGHANGHGSRARSRGERRAHLPRGRGRRDDPHPGRPLLRGPRQAPGGAALTALLELGAKDVAVLDADGRERRDPGRAARGRRPLRGAPRREGGHRRHRRGGRLGGRPVTAHRRVGTGREAARRRGRRRERERRRPARGASDEGGLGHRSGPDREARDRRSDRQGARAAPGRPRLGRLRARRDRARDGHPRLLARRRERRGLRLQRGGRGADHRLPVRARPRHAHRPARGDGPRRAARDPHQGARGARVHAPRGHRRARQDRHGDDRGDDARRRGGGGWRRPRRGASRWWARSSTPPSTR
ncbi:MAG: cation transporter [Thermoleophilaceae bacterium]